MAAIELAVRLVESMVNTPGNWTVMTARAASKTCTAYALTDRLTAEFYRRLGSLSATMARHLEARSAGVSASASFHALGYGPRRRFSISTCAPANSRSDRPVELNDRSGWLVRS
ncbi:MAG: hypothetical protein M3303_06875 [Gemmatimonadota bacterium]|nr:hypothetical protein [Gemmatimonadota bacterium]